MERKTLLKESYIQAARTIVALQQKRPDLVPIVDLSIQRRKKVPLMEEDSTFHSRRRLEEEMSVLSSCMLIEERMSGREGMSKCCNGHYKRVQSMANFLVKTFEGNGKFTSEFPSQKLLEELQRRSNWLMQRSFQETSQIIEENFGTIGDFASILLQKKYMDKREILSFLDN